MPTMHTHWNGLGSAIKPPASTCRFVPDTQPYKAVVSAFVPEKTQVKALDDMRSYIFGGKQDVRPGEWAGLHGI